MFILHYTENKLQTTFLWNKKLNITIQSSLVYINIQEAHLLVNTDIELVEREKCFSYTYCILTLYITSETLGAIIDLHLKVLVNLAAFSIWVILHIANEGLGEIIRPITVMREKTDFQKLLRLLNSHMV